jgi:hypothetical protein
MYHIIPFFDVLKEIQQIVKGTANALSKLPHQRTKEVLFEFLHTYHTPMQVEASRVTRAPERADPEEVARARRKLRFSDE